MLPLFQTLQRGNVSFVPNAGMRGQDVKIEMDTATISRHLSGADRVGMSLVPSFLSWNVLFGTSFPGRFRNMATITSVIYCMLVAGLLSFLNSFKSSSTNRTTRTHTKLGVVIICLVFSSHKKSANHLGSNIQNDDFLPQLPALMRFSRRVPCFALIEQK